jgi:hypothetical protein
MLHLLIAFVAGAVASPLLIKVLRRKVAKVGQEIHLSLDKYDQEMLQAGKLINARVSIVKDVAEKAYGDSGLSAFIHKLF